MRLRALKKLIDEWIDAVDWDEAEVNLFDRAGNLFESDVELGFECSHEQIDGRDVLSITEL